MRSLSTLSNRIKLPILVFLVGLVLITHHTLRSYRQNLEEQRNRMRLEAAQAGAQIAGMAQHLLRKNLPQSVDLLMSYASVSPDLELAAVVDPRSVIRHSTRKQWDGVPLAESPLASMAALAESVRSNMEGTVAPDPSGTLLSAAFPYWEKPDNRSKGVVLLQYNLGRLAAIARRETLHEAVAQSFALSAGSLLFWLMLLEWSASQRLARVVDQARTMVRGGSPSLPIEGEDELARFSRSFSEAAHRIDETELQLTQLAAHIREVFWFAPNVRKPLLFVNPAYEEIWENPSAELRTRRWAWLKRVLPEDRQKALAFLSHLQQGVETAPVELRLSFPDHRRKWVECRGFSVVTPQGAIRAMGGLATDISERKNVDRRLMETAEEERMRIGQDLHDDVCQRMAAALLKGGILHNSLNKEGLPQATLAGQMCTELAAATDIVRGFAHGLAPVVLEAEGLAPALAHLAAFMETAFGVPCWTVCVDLPEGLAPADTTHLYRIAQELAANAARHAQPTGIGITLAREGKNLVLQVSNDGQSFDGNSGNSKGMGLHAVRKHLDALGGSLHFKPSPQPLGGTVAVCEIPLPSHPD